MASVVLSSAALEACRSIDPNDPNPILLFSGSGTSSEDVSAVGAVLNSSHLNYSLVNSYQLNRMPESQISRYRLLIVPGGNFIHIGDHLTAGTTANVRNAVKGGLSYLGICAGAFLAGNSPSPYKSFNLSSGVKFGFYPAGDHKTVVRITSAEGSALDQYWEFGPDLTGWGDVVGKYPDGKPAVVEGPVGQGWVVLTGVHPEAPERWRRGLDFKTAVETDHAYAATLVRAALNRERLAHY
jgi:glutamine amidotransferase-like uncharacterized protein